MTAFSTIARDTLTLLCRRRLFWLNVWLSVGVVLLVASIHCGESGCSVGFGIFSLPSRILVKGSTWETTLFFGVVNRALQWWVTGVAPLLALFSLASVVPKSMRSGQAALLFPKSGSRAAVLLGRFTGGVLFLGVPATVCTLGLFLTLGWRLGVWWPQIFWAVPFALLSFAVLASVTVMLGVLTRSSSAALVVTLIFAVAVLSVQDAASRPAGREDVTELSGMVSQASGGMTALQAVAWVLPRTQQLSEGMEKAINLHGKQRFRDLIRQIRFGKAQVGKAAADVFEQVSDEPGVPVTYGKLGEAVTVTSGFTALVLLLGINLLNRRDL